MSNSTSCIEIYLIRQYLYCPTEVHYILTKNVEPPTERMKRGKEIQKEAVEAIAKTLGAERVEHQVYLKDGICGIIDAVLWIDNRPIPLEVKATKAPKRVPLSHKAQTAAYALAAQTTYRKAVPKAYIYYTENHKTVEIRLDRDTIELVKHTIRQITRIKNGWTPPPRYTTKCEGCWYRKYCGYTTNKIETI